ncbi:hypothetical protein LEP1GSC050_1201 [Leptospira broomii serovar Hurstbridge str. 5399]|uniref:Uncharacterized protein n=1 Tax=Leptospira broomii serovar Hurstbridge str. 5399 TaxID=1049789 RepID=T0F7E6_9LEPT|nr:hypothetical protein LEP1GSC050_1201 [Leptospira broomii serovar Hurstbridge str. 5399]
MTKGAGDRAWIAIAVAAFLESFLLNYPVEAFLSFVHNIETSLGNNNSGRFTHFHCE